MYSILQAMSTSQRRSQKQLITWIRASSIHFRRITWKMWKKDMHWGRNGHFLTVTRNRSCSWTPTHAYWPENWQTGLKTRGYLWMHLTWIIFFWHGGGNKAGLDPEFVKQLIAKYGRMTATEAAAAPVRLAPLPKEDYPHGQYVIKHKQNKRWSCKYS